MPEEQETESEVTSPVATAEQDGSKEDNAAGGTTEPSGDSGARYDFPTVAGLGTPAATAAAQSLGTTCAELAKSGADTAVQRLHSIDKVIADMPFPVLERLIAPERVLDELAEAQDKPVRRLQSWRNQLALIPLLLTWLALALGVLLPFVFSLLGVIALIDAGLIGGLVWITSRIHQMQAAAAQEYHRIANQLDGAMSSLAIAVEHNVSRSTSDAESWAMAVQKAIKDATAQTRELAEQGRETVTAAAAAVEAAHTQGNALIERLTAESTAAMKSFQETYQRLVDQTIKEATTAIQQAIVADHAVINDQFAPLVDQFRASVEDFTSTYGTFQTDTATFVSTVAGLESATKALGDGMQAYAGTAESIDAHLRSIEESQGAFIERVTDSVRSMETAASAMESVSTLLQDRLRADLENIATKLDSSSQRMSQVDTGLTGTAEALSVASHELSQAATALNRAAGGRRRTFFRRGSGRS
jgi:hypothetical protein